MEFDRFTNMATEALRISQRLAWEYSHPEVKSEHLLLALVTQEGGTVASVLGKLGVSTSSLRMSCGGTWIVNLP